MAGLLDEVRLRRRLLTVEEYEALGDAGAITEDDRVELIEGELVAKPKLKSDHAACTFRTQLWFTLRLREVGIVRSQLPIRLPPRSEPEPDVAIVRWRDDYYVRGHPNADVTVLVIEVSDSSLAQDLGAKRAMYAAAGIEEYWVADVRGRRLVVHRQPEGRAYRDVTVLRDGSPTPLAFPELTIDLDDIFGTAGHPQ